MSNILPRIFYVKIAVRFYLLLRLDLGFDVRGSFIGLSTLLD